MGFNISNMRMCKVVRTTSVSIATSGTPQTLTWESAIVNKNGLWVLATNPTRVTINRPGWYHIIAQATFAANATGDRELRVIKNGVAADIIAFSGCKSSTLVTPLTASALVYLASGDYLEVVLNQTSTAALNCTATVVQQQPSLAVILAMPEAHSSGTYERE